MDSTTLSPRFTESSIPIGFREILNVVEEMLLGRDKISVKESTFFPFWSATLHFYLWELEET